MIPLNATGSKASQVRRLALLILSLCCLPWGQALAQAPSPKDLPPTPPLPLAVNPLAMEVESYVMGMTLFFLFHELGHALVDTGALPLLGREEDAVDAFAAVELIVLIDKQKEDPETLARLVNYGYAAIDGWRKITADRGPIDDHDLYGLHSLDQQRFFRTACLLVGGNADLFHAVDRVFNLEESDLTGCKERFFEAFDGWTYTLDSFALLEPLASESLPLESLESSSANDLLFDFLPAERPQHRRWQSLAQQWQDLGRVQQHFSTSFALPEPIPVTFQSCGEENAFYYPETGSVSLCYELMAAAARYHSLNSR